MSSLKLVNSSKKMRATLDHGMVMMFQIKNKKTYWEFKRTCSLFIFYLCKIIMDFASAISSNKKKMSGSSHKRPQKVIYSWSWLSIDAYTRTSIKMLLTKSRQFTGGGVHLNFVTPNNDTFDNKMTSVGCDRSRECLCLDNSTGSSCLLQSHMNNTIKII